MLIFKIGAEDTIPVHNQSPMSTLRVVFEHIFKQETEKKNTFLASGIPCLQSWMINILFWPILELTGSHCWKDFVDFYQKVETEMHERNQKVLTFWYFILSCSIGKKPLSSIWGRVGREETLPDFPASYSFLYLFFREAVTKSPHWVASNNRKLFSQSSGD